MTSRAYIICKNYHYKPNNFYSIKEALSNLESLEGSNIDKSIILEKEESSNLDSNILEEESSTLEKSISSSKVPT